MLLTALDPVCQMKVRKKTAAATTVYNGETYYFCSPQCKSAFKKAPLRYLNRGDFKKKAIKKKKKGGGCCG